MPKRHPNVSLGSNCQPRTAYCGRIACVSARHTLNVFEKCCSHAKSCERPTQARWEWKDVFSSGSSMSWKGPCVSSSWTSSIWADTVDERNVDSSAYRLVLMRRQKRKHIHFVCVGISQSPQYLCRHFSSSRSKEA